MRFAVIERRAHLEVAPDSYIDVEKASRGQFPADPMECLHVWDALREWAFDNGRGPDEGRAHNPAALEAPVPAPGQIFAVGLNYAQHAVETGLSSESPAPLTFTKFRSCIAAPRGELDLPTDSVDWEVELVVVVGAEGFQVPESEAWNHVAGLTLGQDYSERTLQMAGALPQFSLAKSYPGFGPIGPVVVSLDEIADPDDLVLECRVNGATVQHGSVRQLIHSIPKLVAYYSSVCRLRPGDLIFTGTPDGVGMGQTPPVYLAGGDEVVSRCAPIGELRQHCRASDRARHDAHEVSHG